MSEQWHADIEINDVLVKNCLETQFPELKPIQHILCLGEGWDNKVYLINNHLVFRFPRRIVAVELIERENTILKALQNSIALEIPNPIYVGKPSNHYPYPFPFHGYEMISGASGCHAGLSEEERIASIRPLTYFLKTLHEIKETQAIHLGAKTQIYDRTDAQKMTTALTERVNKIVSRGICKINMSVFDKEIEAGLTIRLSQQALCLVHGDLYCRHLMFNQGKLTGIIDWGDVSLNHPAVDLAVIWSFYPQHCHAIFWEHYGIIEASTWKYARFLGLYSAFTVMLYGFDIGDTLLVKEAIDSVMRINHQLCQI